MLGKFFIPYHTNRHNQKNVRRFSRSFEDATSVGVLCSYKSLIGENKAVEWYIDELKDKGKKVSLLIFHENSSNAGGISNNSFSKRDLNFFGIWKKERVKVFIDKQFDFLIYLDLDYNLFIGNVVARSKAHCRIGIYNDHAKPFLELMIKPEQKTIESLIIGIVAMLERIKNDE